MLYSAGINCFYFQEIGKFGQRVFSQFAKMGKRMLYKTVFDMYRL